MKITFPHMGNLAIPLQAIFRHLNLNVVLPPATTAQTVKLGSKYAPEQICLPFKINLGNLIEAHQLGADTMIMLGGCGPCRFGYFGALLHQILTDLGMNYRFIYLDEQLLATVKTFKDQEKLSWWQIYRSIQLGWEKLKLLEELTDRACWLRPVLSPTELTAFEVQLQGIRDLIEKAITVRELKQIYDLLPQVTESSELLKVLLVGDIYTILEPSCNYYLEQELGKRGVVVLHSVKVSEWFLTAIKGLQRSRQGKNIMEKAKPYLRAAVGGHGLHTIGNSAAYAGKVDGIIHLMPFSCTPELVAASILPLLSTDLQIPVLRLAIDEHASSVAVNTRIEAFIDLLQRKKLKNLI